MKDFLYRGEECVHRFLTELVATEAELRESLKQKAKLQMTEQDWCDFNGAGSCHICKKYLVKHNQCDGADVFCPRTGENLGKAHRFKNAPDSRLSCFFEVYNQIKPDDGKWAKRQPKPDDLEEEDDAICINCDEPLLRPQFRDAVRDHCHITGKYRGAAHNSCNRSYFRIDPKRAIIPVVFHNLKGYDAHHLMRHIAEIEPAPQGPPNLRCIPNNMEKYISFSLGRLRFIDSYQFLLSGLDSLVSTNKHEDFEIIKRLVTEPEKRGLLFRKGVYPYEYMDSFEKFNETFLPSKESFYSKNKKAGISDEDYVHAKQVWEAFECENLGDYHDLYLAVDVILLADVFETFRKTCLRHYGLDPAHYFTSPGLSWDALLKHTGIQLELLTDYNKYLFIEKGMRGGISTEMKRYCKAYNPYIQDYNPQEETAYVIHLDANNLYGWAMSQYLPVGNFAWMRNMPTKEQIMSWRPDRKRGFILEVDLEYPQELHDEHNSYPLAPAHKSPKSGCRPTNKPLQES